MKKQAIIIEEQEVMDSDFVVLGKGKICKLSEKRVQDCDDGIGVIRQVNMNNQKEIELQHGDVVTCYNGNECIVFNGLILNEIICIPLDELNTNQLNTVTKIVRGKTILFDGNYPEKMYTSIDDKKKELQSTANKLAEEIQDKISELERLNSEVTDINNKFRKINRIEDAIKKEYELVFENREVLYHSVKK